LSLGRADLVSLAVLAAPARCWPAFGLLLPGTAVTLRGVFLPPSALLERSPSELWNRLKRWPGGAAPPRLRRVLAWISARHADLLCLGGLGWLHSGAAVEDLLWPACPRAGQDALQALVPFVLLWGKQVEISHQGVGNLVALAGACFILLSLLSRQGEGWRGRVRHLEGSSPATDWCLRGAASKLARQALRKRALRACRGPRSCLFCSSDYGE
jgi:hypothetical protein